MPEDFNKCVADGGKVITKTLPNGQYIHLCRDNQGGWHKGEVKTKENVREKYKESLKGRS